MEPVSVHGAFLAFETTTFSPVCENEETHYEYRYFQVSGQ